MEEGGESFTGRNKKQIFEGKLNTKGCCFLCLTVIDFKTEGANNKRAEAGTATKHPVSLKMLNRYLNISLENPPKVHSVLTTKENSSCSSSLTSKDKDIQVDLCQPCGKILQKFSKLFLSLEKVQTEMAYWQGKIHQQISNAWKMPELVQNYSKRMTSDPETLTQLVFVDNLRKEISKMALEKGKTTPKANVKLKRLDLKALKKKKAPVDSSSATIQTSISAPRQVMAPAETQEPQIAHLLKFEHQEEYDEDDAVEETPPNSPNLPPPHSPIPSMIHDLATKTKNCKRRNEQEMRLRTESDTNRKIKGVSTPTHPLRKWKCDICKLSAFSALSNLNTHKKTCRDTLQQRLSAFKARQDDPKYKFGCKTCGKKFSSRSDMLQHIRVVHLKERKYACDLCNKTFLNLSNLKVHKNAVHLGITLKCGVCSKEFKYQIDHRRHERICEKKSAVTC